MSFGPQLLVTVALELIVMALFAGAAGSLYVMWRGYKLCRANRLKGLERNDRSLLLKSPLASPVSVVGLVPDASARSLEFVHNLVKLHYGDHEVLLVLDGPDEEELGVWIKEFRLFPSTRAAAASIPTKPVRAVYESNDPIRLTVIEKDRGGTADCLNVAFNLAGAPLLGLADASSNVAPDGLLRLVRPFMEEPELMVATCGVIPPAWAGSQLARFQILEELRGWFGRTAGLASWNAALPLPGAFSLISRKAVLEANGFYSGTLEMFVHLHGMYRTAGKPYRVQMVQEAVASQLPPRSVSELRRMTVNDQHDVLRALWRHTTVMFGYGALGWVGIPGLLWSRALRPLLETAGYALAIFGLAAHFIQWQLAAQLFLVAVVVNMLHSMLAVVLREFVAETPSPTEHLMGLFVAAVPENIGYRQVRNLWLIAGLIGLGGGGTRRSRRALRSKKPKLVID